MLVNIFFARSDSHYKGLRGVDVFDIERNALTVKKTNQQASVYHPPCRAWGQLKGFAKPRSGERKLAIWSLIRVKRYGGVLEHPVNSSLFKKYKNMLDGGITIDISQVWFGHKARKETRLYIKGLSLSELPTYKVISTKPTHQVTRMRKIDKYGVMYYASDLPELSKKDRERTPIMLSKWLVKICRLIETKKKQNNGVLQEFGQTGLW